MTTKLNEPAFPVGSGVVMQTGMTLRDYFAGQALAGLMANPSRGDDNSPDYAYFLADGMLAERVKAERRQWISADWTETPLYTHPAPDTAALVDCLFKTAALIGHAMPMTTTALVAGETLLARDVWEEACAILEHKGTEHG